ncbi:unnamed protein product [Closterium sp. NIES-53]
MRVRQSVACACARQWHVRAPDSGMARNRSLSSSLFPVNSTDAVTPSRSPPPFPPSPPPPSSRSPPLNISPAPFRSPAPFHSPAPFRSPTPLRGLKLPPDVNSQFPVADVPNHPAIGGAFNYFVVKRPAIGGVPGVIA